MYAHLQAKIYYATKERDFWTDKLKRIPHDNLAEMYGKDEKEIIQLVGWYDGKIEAYTDIYNRYDSNT